MAETVSTADGLRKLADIVEQHPDVFRWSTFGVSLPAPTLLDLADLSSRLGGKWTHTYDGDVHRFFNRPLGEQVVVSLAVPLDEFEAVMT